MLTSAYVTLKPPRACAGASSYGMGQPQRLAPQMTTVVQPPISPIATAATSIGPSYTLAPYPQQQLLPVHPDPDSIQMPSLLEQPVSAIGEATTTTTIAASHASEDTTAASNLEPDGTIGMGDADSGVGLQEEINALQARIMEKLQSPIGD